MKPRTLRQIVDAALAEDVGRGDVTATALFSKDARARATIFSKSRGVLAGMAPAKLVFERLDPGCRWKGLLSDGAALRPGVNVAIIEGRARGLLSGERTALNFLQRLSGVATLSREFAARARGSTVLDTRKTTPGLRDLEKAAVAAGGAKNHRRGLWDAAMVKDNHRALLRRSGGELRGIARLKSRGLHVTVEAANLQEACMAASNAQVDRVLLDNFTLRELARTIALLRRWEPVEIEVSGGVTLRNIAAIARLRPDFISVGALTHSAPALDLSMDVEPL